MRRADHLQKTMTALRNCIEQCRLAVDSTAALERMLAELRHDPELSDADLEEIDRLARRALAACDSLRRKAS